jgi:hypothetical protein
MMAGTTHHDNCVNVISVQGSWDAFEYLDATEYFEDRTLSMILPVDLVLLNILKMGIHQSS